MQKFELRRNTYLISRLLILTALPSRWKVAQSRGNGHCLNYRDIGDQAGCHLHTGLDDYLKSRLDVIYKDCINY